LGKDIASSERVLFHEYAHHVMHSVSQWSKPRWLSEGFAEFFSSAQFEKNGGVGLGLPAQHRAYELFEAKDVGIEALLGRETYKKSKSSAYDEFYGRSWLLYHYLTLSGERKGQLTQYEVALANGASELDAARKAFGDLKLLEKEMNSYLNNSKMNYLPISGDKLSVGPITVRKMREAEAAIMPVILKSKRGVTKEMAKALLPRAQAVAVKHPNDPTVLSALAEAEHDAGNYAIAIEMADKALALDPKSPNAHVQKIYALAQLAEKAEDKEAAWKHVRKASVVFNKIENDHPIPLIYYYRSYAEMSKNVPEVAAHGLERALSLAPFDQRLRWDVVQQLLDEEKYMLAHFTLLPLANDPHNRSEDNPALKLLAEVKKKIEMQALKSEGKPEKKTAEK
jgi:tetratricopeptide (TPR) repeat protein